MNMKLITIATDFTDAPGARYRTDGEKSGQEFYEDHLKIKFEEALKDNAILTIDLDGTWGYPSSFISEVFGRLGKEYGASIVLKHIHIKSDEDKDLKDLVFTEIQAETYDNKK